MKDFSVDQIKAMAEIERAMDSGELPFLVLGSERFPCPLEIMEEFGLESGQTVNIHIMAVVVEAMIGLCDRKAAAKKAH